MRSQILLKPPYHYRAKTSYLFAGLGVLFVAGMCALKIRDGGTGVLLTACWSWYLVAYACCYFFLRPKVLVDAEQVTIYNPLVTTHLSYNRIVGLDTQYQLSITTDRGKYKALGAPVAGVIGSETHRAMMTDMGGAVFRGESLMQVSGGGVAGDAGRMIVGYLKELTQENQLASMPVIEKRTFDYLGGGILLILLVLAIVL